MDLFDHVQAVRVDVVLRDVDDLDRVWHPGLFADTPVEGKHHYRATNRSIDLALYILIVFNNLLRSYEGYRWYVLRGFKINLPSNDRADAPAQDFFGVVLEVEAEGLVPSGEAVFLGHHGSVHGRNFRILSFVPLSFQVFSPASSKHLIQNFIPSKSRRIRHSSFSGTFHFIAVTCSSSSFENLLRRFRQIWDLIEALDLELNEML